MPGLDRIEPMALLTGEGVGILVGILVRDVLRSYSLGGRGGSYIKVIGMIISKFKLNP